MVFNGMGIFSRKDEKVELTVSNKTIVRVVVMVLGSLLLLAAMRQAAHALTLIFLAFFLALALNAPVHWISTKLPGKKRGSRTMATTVSFVIVVLVLGLFFASIVPPLVRQTGSFVDSVPGLIDDLRDPDSTLGQYVEKYNLHSQVNDLSTQAADWAKGVTQGAVGTVGRLGSSVVSVLTVLVLTFMMLIEGPKWIRLGRRLTPDRREAHYETLARSMYKVIKGYVNGQVLLAAVAAVLILPILLIMNVGYPFALMVVVFICGLIPMVGHTIGAILVSLVALFTSPVAAVVVFGYYVLYQQIENYAIQPKIQANSTDMSPLLVFGSVVVGVSFSGIVGGLVAIPVAGCLRILMLDYLRRRNYIETEEIEVVSEDELPEPEKT